MKTAPTLDEVVSCLSDYDPNALAVAQAQHIIDEIVQPVAGIEKVAIRAALGRVLASEVVSSIDVPAHDNSAMDGYAVRWRDLAADGDTRLHVAGKAYAGRPFDGEVGHKEAVRVMTGTVMPADLDTVVVQEIAHEENGEVVIPAGQSRGQNRRLRGEDLAAGTTALAAGKILAPADLGLLASLGIAEVPIRRRLRVAFFSTGDELRSLGEPLAAGTIYDSNRYTIYGMLERLGIEPIDMGVVDDNRAALEHAMRTASEHADAIISTGGVSVGEADFTRLVMAELGDVAFWKIAMRPGRPMAFGRVGRALYFGLPGNPVAVMVTFYFFARDALLRMMGAQRATPPMLAVRSENAIRKKPGRTEYQRGILKRSDNGAWSVSVTGQQGSGVLRSMSEANCMIVLHHDQSSVQAGDPVDVLLFDGLV
jgi:molybdopterin molybdotransferase